MPLPDKEIRFFLSFAGKSATKLHDIWSTISKKGDRGQMAKPLEGGQNLQGGDGPLAAQNSTCWTCSPTLRERACTSAIRWATSPRTSTRATSGSRDSTSSTRWVTTPSAFPPSSMRSRRGSIPPSRPSRTSPATANSWTRSDSRSTGTARCARATPDTTSGRSGRSSRCSPIGTTVRNSRRAPSRN